MRCANLRCYAPSNGEDRSRIWRHPAMVVSMHRAPLSGFQVSARYSPQATRTARCHSYSWCLGRALRRAPTHLNHKDSVCAHEARVNDLPPWNAILQHLLNLCWQLHQMLHLLKDPQNPLCLRFGFNQYPGPGPEACVPLTKPVRLQGGHTSATNAPIATAAIAGRLVVAEHPFAVTPPKSLTAI